MYLGIDTAARINAERAQRCVQNGVSWVGRYLVPEGYGKALTASEAKILRDAGLSILLCWEINAGDMKSGAARGARHGEQARQLADGMGVPAGTTIFFAADWDVQSYEMSACVEYMKAAQNALGNYVAGIYGGEAVCRRMYAEGYRRIWQCIAWTNEFLPYASAIQYAWQGSTDAQAMAQILGFGVDLDQCADMIAAGLWLAKEYEPKDPWYTSAMNWAEENGLLNDGRPEDYVTRAELATVEMRNDERLEAKMYRIAVEVIKSMQPEDDKKYGGLISN